MNKRLDTHDVRQAAYRGEGPDTSQTGIPKGSTRHDPSHTDAPVSRETADEAKDDHTGTTQPNMGQAGTYGADGEETQVTSRNRVDKH